MNAYLFKDADAVRKQINGLVAKFPELSDDAELLADMLEGETDLYRILERALSARREAETMAAAIKIREGDISDRRKRFERQAENLKVIMLSLMDAAGQSKITLPEATLSIRAGRQSVDITDENELTQGFFKTERVPLKAEIQTALEAGQEVPGARLVPGKTNLTIRTK